MPFRRVNKRRRPEAAQLLLHPVPVRRVRHAPELHAEQHRRQIPVEKIQQPPRPLPLFQVPEQKPRHRTGTEHHDKHVDIKTDDAKAEKHNGLFRGKTQKPFLLI